MIYKLEVAICKKDNTWEPRDVEVEFDDEATEGEMTEAASDLFITSETFGDVVSVGLLSWERTDVDEGENDE